MEEGNMLSIHRYLVSIVNERPTLHEHFLRPACGWRCRSHRQVVRSASLARYFEAGHVQVHLHARGSPSPRKECAHAYNVSKFQGPMSRQDVYSSCSEDNEQRLSLIKKVVQPKSNESPNAYAHGTAKNSNGIIYFQITTELFFELIAIRT